MKNLFSFSDNPLNTDKLLYMVMKKALKPKIEGAKAAKESKENASVTEIAKTMVKLATMITLVDLKVEKAEKEFRIYRNSELYDPASKSDPRKKAFFTQKRRGWFSRLITYKKIQKKMLKINEEFQNIDAIKNKKYGKVKAETLTALNKEMDLVAKDNDIGIDLRQLSLNIMAKIAFRDLLVIDKANLNVLTGIFSMMNDGDKPLIFNGMKITKKGNKISIAYKKHKVEYSIAAVGKNMQWEIRDSKGEKIQKKPKKQVLEGLFEGSSEPGIASALSTYYKPKSVTSFYTKVKGRVTPKKVVAKKPAPKPAKVKKRIPVKVKVFAEKPKPKVAPKKIVAKTPSKPKPKVEKWKEAIVESPKTNAALKKWGNEISRKIAMAANSLYSRITAVRQFLNTSKEKNKINHLTKYKNALSKVAKATKATNGTDVIKAVNQLADVYKILPKGLSTEWKKKFKIKLTQAPKNEEKVALLPSLLQKSQEQKPKPTTRPKPKIRYAAKPKQKVKAKITAKPKATIAAKEKVERNPGLKKWAKQNANMLKDIRKEFIIHNDLALIKLYPKHAAAVLTRLNTLNRALKKPNITFVKAVQLCKDLRRGFRHMQKRATEKKIHYVTKVKGKISKMTTLDFPPAPKNPTVAEHKLLKTENKRVAGIKKFTKDITV